MNCREAADLLPLLFDGELEARQAGQVERHAGECTACRQELADLRELHVTLSQSISARVDQMDLSTLWPAVAKQLPKSKPKLLERWQSRWQEFAAGLQLGIPAVAAAAAVAALAYVFAVQSKPTVVPGAQQVATVDYANSIEQLESPLSSVAVFHDPDTRSTLLWVGDTGPTSEDFQ